MKTPWLLTGLMVALLSQNCLALEKCASSIGNVILRHVTIGCMNINGSADMAGTTFKGDLLLTGPLKASGTSFQGINVTGSVDLQNARVAGETFIIGGLDATTTTFQKKLTINANKIQLVTSTTQDIVIETGSPSTLTLTNCTVNGNVTFRNGNGTVTNNNSKISGKILQE
jgi:hypothetical protein